MDALLLFGDWRKVSVLLTRIRGAPLLLVGIQYWTYGPIWLGVAVLISGVPSALCASADLSTDRTLGRPPVKLQVSMALIMSSANRTRTLALHCANIQGNGTWYVRAISPSLIQSMVLPMASPTVDQMHIHMKSTTRAH